MKSALFQMITCERGFALLLINEADSLVQIVTVSLRFYVSREKQRTFDLLWCASSSLIFAILLSNACHMSRRQYFIALMTVFVFDTKTECKDEGK
jgi:hypothetical protein